MEGEIEMTEEERRIEHKRLCDNYAHNRVKSGTWMHYRLSSQQVAIHPPPEGVAYEDFLNEDGLALLNSVRKRVEAKDFDATYERYTRENWHSGGWWADAKSPFYNKQEALFTPNAYANVLFQSYPHDDTPVYMAVFYTNEWAYTADGRLYELGELV